MDGEPYRVISGHRATYPDPLKVDKDNAAWAWCIGPSGKGGWMPCVYFEGDGERGTALRDYDAAELSVEAGEDPTVHHEESGWAWARDSRGRFGWVPLECVKRVA
ncbi:MAG: SH3 domain-containing protein [Rubrobacteraceae bacterium]|jgi:hypothetical protein|nr:hypothetical protein [Rubrobacter sp.]MBA3790290.1 hypothetical protein [Rubrobacter sp.]MDQ3237676.1 SH3 domain-containing protein [Actinomycetota bacterium]